MILTFMYHPVTDLETAVAFHRDVLGLDEAWREGADTVAFDLPGTGVQLMLDASGSSAAGPGGFYRVDDVDAFHEAHGDSVTWVELPVDQPPIRCAAFVDPAGTLMRIFHELD